MVTRVVMILQCTEMSNHYVVHQRQAVLSAKYISKDK